MPLPAFVQTFRDPELSLWQAAVNHVLGDASAHLAATTAAAAGGSGASLARENPFLHWAAQTGTTVETVRSLMGRDPVTDLLPDKPTLEAADLPSPPVVLGSFPTFGLVVIALARKVGDDPDLFMDLLKQRYGDLDPRWAQAALNYFLFVKLGRQGIPGYRRYADLGDFGLDGKLPDQARVALVGDWGTGTSEATAVLQKIAEKKPDVVIHLGDVYYAGAEKQFALFRQQFQDILQYDQPGGPVVLTLSGNHDMYSGGGPYYETLDAFHQPASYFCLRNAHWQFVAMDTGYTNSAIKLTPNPDDSDDPNGLDPKEADWATDKVVNAGGRRTILLSHHQLFSAFERQTHGGPVNQALLGQMRDVLGSVCRWYWGHEHDLVVYLDAEYYLGVLGRCIGHGAIPMDAGTYRLEALWPESKDGFTVPKWDDTVQLDPMLENPHFRNHGYVIIDLNAAAGTATHYQASDPEKVLRIEQLA
jgi:hypothetical protein